MFSGLRVPHGILLQQGDKGRWHKNHEERSSTSRKEIDMNHSKGKEFEDELEELFNPKKTQCFPTF